MRIGWVFGLGWMVLGASLVEAAGPADWPQWRGPTRDGHAVGALVALNAFGRVVDPDTGQPLSHPTADGPGHPPAGSWRGQTTLAVVATDIALDRPSCRVVARMASAALARTLRPAFTPFDGDVVIALSTGEGPSADPGTLLRIGDAAATALARAITGLYAGSGG